MGISDILSDSSHMIRRTLEQRPEAYAKHRPKIDDVLERMDALREELDFPDFLKEALEKDR